MKLKDVCPLKKDSVYILWGESFELSCMLITANAFSLLTCISYIVIETLNGVIQCFQFNMGQSMLFGCATCKPHTQNEVRKMESGLKKKTKTKKELAISIFKTESIYPMGLPRRH